tara:strand:- start:327 stop:548 length:222 start_codon:yes stop_codon:yes gene_type:complete
MNRWWYFHREENELILASDSDFDERPLDAAPSNGTPHTPWYNHKNHIDLNHVHIYAPNLETAFKKAKNLLDTE